MVGGCAPEKKETFRLSSSFRELQSPSVEYRGIFINDEDWGLMPWSNKTYEPSDVKGEIGPRTNERIFELLLRLRANTYWPAMHECTFLSSDEGQSGSSEKYGIFMGASHCEPMACSAAGEWRIRGKGAYDYVNNSPAVLSVLGKSCERSCRTRDTLHAGYAWRSRWKDAGSQDGRRTESRPEPGIC